MIEAELILQTNDLERAKRFYSAIARELGYKLFDNRFYPYSWNIGRNLLLTLAPASRAKHVNINSCSGSSICLMAKEFSQVDSVYARAVELGATEFDEPHTPDAFYRASFCDLDGHRIEIACGI